MENLAKNLEVSLLVVDLGKAIENKTKFENTILLALREAYFFIGQHEINLQSSMAIFLFCWILII